ncbi:PaaX family transcriptional regulator C-terminal domain-containing protein [Microbacterium sp. SORGH_AS_0888]|uniref:PaaX family transcriptional regulator n=1 Tax=Microbacterium sp. SORGH_AS_0888 TaxID=3041791 RepID=UPI0027893FF8|nr:PaaX family transcriptional regulator C-terminal domain-containing protein [Microbacterium sp. SORGH_AS_0888]MDQ1130381.1 phenylacetic acid degradation operon negative regulatory protein [Microbacterium sp. SORGH_AS_0888]
MRPRSLVFTLYGDYFRYCADGAAPLAGLSDVMELFGVERATTRMVMSRLRADGWFDAVRDGRRTTYRLASRGWGLLDAGRERIFRHDSESGDGQWTLVLTRTADRAARDEFRKNLAWLGFGSLQPATWIAPGDRRASAQRALDEQPAGDGDVFLTRTDDLVKDREIAARAWDLQALDDQYRRFVERHEGTGEGALEELSDDEALVRRVRLTDDYRRFPYADPDLPARLLPDQWAGAVAHALFAERHEALREAAVRAIEAHTGLHVTDPHRVVFDGARVTYSVTA